MRAGLSPAVKVLDLKERLRYRDAAGSGGPSFRSSGGGRDRERRLDPAVGLHRCVSGKTAELFR